jgi:CheY-like chemotaxis protein
MVGSLIIMPAKHTILLVEDNESLRVLIQYALQASGYVLLIAANGAEALQMGRQHPAAIELLIADLELPGMRGPQVSAQFRKDHPETRTLYISGDIDEAVLRPELDAGNDYLAKPFTISTLERKIRELLKD